MFEKNCLSTSRRRLLAAASLTPLAFADVSAQTTPAVAPPPLDTFFRDPALRGLVLSPTGTHIAGIRPVNGRENVVVFDLAARKSLIITNFRDSDVADVKWVNGDWLVLGVYDRSRGSGDQMFSGLHSIQRDANGFRSLAERSSLSDGGRLLPWGSKMLSQVRDAEGQLTDEIIVETPRWQGRGRFEVRLYRVNVANGHFSPLDLRGSPRNVTDFVLDSQGLPRAALAVDEDGRSSLFVRDDAQAPWRVIASYAADESGAAMAPIKFDKQGRLYVTANAGSDFQGIYTLDLKTGKLDPEPVVAVKGFDLGSNLVFRRDGDGLLGVHLEADRPLTVWFDEARRRTQAAVDQALPGMHNRLQFAGDDPTGKAPVLVSSSSDTDPGRFYLFDRETSRLASIGASRPWVKPEQMRPWRFFRYDTPDGLSIPAMVMTPSGEGPFPLVVLHYGGPWVRPIHHGWDENVQFLVSRGYAVFMPAPRGSTGFGYKLFRAGWKQWGLGMQDDVTVGVRSLIAERIADPKRVALVGASYGGYLTMMGLVKEPDLFRCGVDWVGVTDPGFMFSVTWSDFSRADSGRFRLDLLLGDPDKDKELFERTSPLKRAAEIKQPVLMAYGGLDKRVPIIHGERMRDALKAHNPNVEWVVYPDEGHGWLRLENKLDFWGRVERFLQKNLPPASE